MTEKELLEKIEKIEKELQDKSDKITSLEKENKEYASKLATAKVDSLVKKVDEVQPPKVEEEITFDFEY